MKHRRRVQIPKEVRQAIKSAGNSRNKVEKKLKK
jgi:hypothetical protein